MVSVTLSDIIDARRAEARIQVGPNQVLAIDVNGDFAAVFRLDLGPNGEARAEATIARRGTFGRWVEIVSGGTSLRLPQPFTRDSLGSHLNLLGTAGANTFLADDTEVETSAMIGVASNSADSLLVATTDGERELPIGVSGAFVILATRPARHAMADTPLGFVTPRRHGIAIATPTPIR